MPIIRIDGIRSEEKSETILANGTCSKFADSSQIVYGPPHPNNIHQLPETVYHIIFYMLGIAINVNLLEEFSRTFDFFVLDSTQLQTRHVPFSLGHEVNVLY